MDSSDYTLTAVARAIATGERSAEDVAREMLRRCAERHELHALIAQDPERVLEKAR